MTRINPKFIEAQTKLMQENAPIDVTSTYNQAIQWLIRELALRGRPYKLHQLGAGVKRVTTDTDVCPCCKKAL
jgi:hypothetical protein